MNSEASSRSQLKVMSFNIRYDTHYDKENRWDNRKDFAARVVLDEVPDLVGLQEANLHQYEYLLNILDNYVGVGEGRDGGKRGEFSAILYSKDRFELIDSGTFWLSDTPDKPSRNWGNSVRRICTWAHFIEIGGHRPLFYYNTHLDHKSQASREKGMALIMRHIANKTAKGDVILSGDLNSEEDNPVIGIIQGDQGVGVQGGLLDTFRNHDNSQEDIGTHHRYKGNKDGKRIDYIFISRGLESLSSEIIRVSENGRYPSDHFPITATVRRKK